MADHLSPACRILVVASELSTALDLIDNIISTSAATQNNQYDPIDDIDNEGCIVEWTISNKYYDANVHFLAKTPSLPPAKPLWPPETDQDKVPAIIFVFCDGEPFEQRFLSLKNVFDEHEAEINIAIRVPTQGGDPDASDVQEDRLIDFFAEHTFEFVEVLPGGTPTTTVEPHDIQGIPRVINALSTVIWPSLVRKPRPPPAAQDLLLPPQTAESITRLRDSSVFPEDFIPDKPDGEMDHQASLFLQADNRLAENDLQALEAWLDGDVDAPWKGDPASVSDPRPSPTPQTSSGFEDDFDEFVSAPTDDQSGLPQAVDLDQEESMPSKEEVMLTAQRIFGRQPAELNASADDFHFDLNEVLGVLQAMKEEVAEISDAEARRKAAARIALGFASGLGLSGDD